MSDSIVYVDELYHHGILGQKWGKKQGPPYPLEPSDHSASEKKAGWSKSLNDGTRIKKGPHISTSVRGAMAKRSNQKVDKSFEKWKHDDLVRDTTISSGKKANISKIAYEKDRSNKELKKQYKIDKNIYQKDLRKTTTYRKGQVKHEVGQDLSRKYLSEAKKVQKELYKNPNDIALQKKYNTLMDKYEIERERARKAPQVAQTRSAAKTKLKKSMKSTVETVAIASTIAVGSAAVNHYLSNNNVTLNGKEFRVNAKMGMDALGIAKNVARTASNAARYVY